MTRRLRCPATQIPVESPAARLQRVVYKVYLRHGKVVLPGVW